MGISRPCSDCQCHLSLASDLAFLRRTKSASDLPLLMIFLRAGVSFGLCGSDFLTPIATVFVIGFDKYR